MFDIGKPSVKFVSSVVIRKDAVVYLNQAYKFEPSGEVAMSLARAFISQQNHSEATKILESQLSKAVYPALLHFYLKIEKELGRIEHARNFIATLRRTPGIYVHSRSEIELARWEAELSSLMNDWPRAITAYQQALILAPTDEELWNDYGLTLKKAGNYARADRSLMTAQHLNPNNFVPVINRLEIAVELNDASLVGELVSLCATLSMPPKARERIQAIEKEYGVAQGNAPHVDEDKTITPSHEFD